MQFSVDWEVYILKNVYFKGAELKFIIEVSHDFLYSINKWNTNMTFFPRPWNSIVSNETPRNGVLLEKLMDYWPGEQMHQRLWNLKAFKCIHENPQLDPTICQMNRVHTFCVSQIHFSITIPSMPGSPKCSLLKLCVGISYSKYSAHLICLYLITPVDGND